MNPNMLCSKCKKRMAVVFITRMDGDKPVNEGLCIKCAKEMNIQPVIDLLDKMGITDEQLDAMDDQMMGLIDSFGDSFDMGGAQSMPFMQMFNMQQGPDEDGEFEPENELELYDEGDGADSQLPDLAEEPESVGRGASAHERRKQEKERKKYKFLTAHCENLTQKARDGRIDRIVGREKEIERVIQILNRRTKNNPCLVGEPGVGKTAIAEGIAQKLADGSVPAQLQGKELYLLDMTSLVAGTQFRGQFESRVKGLIDDVRKAGNVILFIDEVHSLVGAGDSEGSMNAANILKPALSRGEIQVIGATTFDEYRKHIEKDAALERRFQPVKVDQPSVDQTIEVLKGIKGYYEQYHRVTVTDDIARRAVLYSERYINDRFLPDKAIDLLDEACSCANLRNKTLAQYDEYNRQIKVYQDVIERDESGENAQVDYEKLAENKAKVLQLQNQADQIKDEALGQKVTDEDLAKVVELWTGIPASKIQASEMQRVAGLEEAIKKRVIGQDEAVGLVAAAVRRSRVQISKKRRPASFIFVGPTGVGKTELVKVLSEELFDKQNPLIRLDMSEFMEKHSVARIIGAPPGYVGYDEAGQLTEKVRRRPYSVVLFDEIEKAHPDVMNILLQILDEGKITDAQGRIVSFESTVIVMTSNCGTEQRAGSLGFNKTTGDMARERVMQSLSEFLRPEFLGRVDEVVLFRQLSEEDFVKIAALILDELREPLAEKGITCRWTDQALQWLAHNAHGKQGGARDLRRLIRKEVEDKICALLVERYDAPPAGIQIGVEDDKIALAVLD